MKQRVHRHEVIQPLDPSYKLIPLTQGQNAIVDTEDFEWLCKWNWYAAWDQSTASFYALRGIRHAGSYSNIRMHRFIMNSPEGQEIDHENRNGLDNRKKNLRKCSSSQNSCNRIHPKGASGYIGVCKRKGYSKWRATIGLGRKSKSLGDFDTPDEAAKVRDQAAIQLHGQFAVLNFPERHI